MKKKKKKITCIKQRQTKVSLCNSEGVSDSCLTPTQQFICNMMARTS